MTFYYCVRYLHNPHLDTLYYIGGGRWSPIINDRVSPRMFTKEEHAKLVIENETQCDWFCVELEN